MKALLLAAKTVAGRKAGEPCKECGGPNPKYWYGVCPCGWHGTADKASGGGPLGDTGDFGDVHCPACDREDELEDGSCPTCARFREIAEWCWHDVDSSQLSDAICNNRQAYIKCSCMDERITYENWMMNEYWEHNNPTFTVQTVRALLTDLGELDNFLDYLWHDECPECNPDNPWYRKFAKECMTDEDMIAKATTFLEGQHGA